MKIEDAVDASESAQTDIRTVLVTDAHYTEEDHGTGERPVLWLSGRSQAGERVEQRVVGKHPYFFVSEDEFVQRRDDIEREMDAANPRLLDYEFGHTAVDKETNEEIDAVKLVCELPKHVGQLREEFEKTSDGADGSSDGDSDTVRGTWEADVLYPYRCLIDMGVTDVYRAPSDDEIHHSDVASVDDAPTIEPRVLTSDIEVHVGSGGFPDPTVASNQVTAITAHDSDSDEYATFVLYHPLWDDVQRRDVTNVYDELTVDGECHVFEDEKALLAEYVSWVNDVDPDVLTGFNSDAFDYPYVVNRCFEKSVYSIRQWSPTESVWSIDDVPRGTNRSIKGLMCWDCMTAFKKSQIHELKSYSLDAIASEVLDHGKEPIEDIDDAWKHDPVTFTEYNVRDVEAVVGIMREEDLLETYLNVQSLTGTLLSDVHHNRNIVDHHFLRAAASDST